MNTRHESVFFYGLFMDESLLASKGISPLSATIGYVDDYSLRIGSRASLVPEAGGRAHGVLMSMRAGDLQKLYSDESVADYVSESVSVVLPGGTCRKAVCYNLPQAKLKGANSRYAKDLLDLAANLDLPREYLQQIRGQIE